MTRITLRIYTSAGTVAPEAILAARDCFAGAECVDIVIDDVPEDVADGIMLEQTRVEMAHGEHH